MANLGQSVYATAYEYSPIILVNGIAGALSGYMLPIIAITQAANFGFDLVSGNNPLNPNDFFGHFRPLPGTTLVDNDVAMYPFANQAYAANALIAKPLKISMLMNAPANIKGGYASKLITFTALKYALEQHNQKGGTYAVATPSYVYLGCILQNLVDVSRPDSQQPQNAWQFDFIQPLTSEQPTNTLSALMTGFQNASSLLG